MRVFDWATLVRGMLRSGYGVEDIAIKITEIGIDTTPDMVRDYVKKLRADGRLIDVIRPKWRKFRNAIREDERSGNNQPPQQASQSDPV